MTVVVVACPGHYPSVYGPFSSEAERWDFIDSVRREGYECTTLDMRKPFDEPKVVLLSR